MNENMIWHVCLAAILFIFSFRILIVAMYSDEYDNMSVWLEVISAVLCVGAVVATVTA